MYEIITQIIIGLFLIIVGIMNMKGNISLIHSYHRKRIKKEDIIPFGKKTGIGSIIIGISIIIATLLSILNYNKESNIIMAIGLIIGLIIIFYSIIKYNKGLF